LLPTVQHYGVIGQLVLQDPHGQFCPLTPVVI